MNWNTTARIEYSKEYAPLMLKLEKNAELS